MSWEAFSSLGRPDKRMHLHFVGIKSGASMEMRSLMYSSTGSMLCDDVNKRMETTHPNMFLMLCIQIYKYVNIKPRRGRRDNINNDESIWCPRSELASRDGPKWSNFHYFRPLRPLRAKIIRKFPAFQAKHPSNKLILASPDYTRPLKF